MESLMSTTGLQGYMGFRQITDRPEKVADKRFESGTISMAAR